MKNLLQRILPIIAITGSFSCGVAEAAIQLSSTRVIMNERDKNVSVFAKNLGATPLVVQAWIDGEFEEMDTPFFITPPLSRFDASSERSLNIARVAGQLVKDLPGDRESYFWINVLEIPQKAEGGQNKLTLATRTRIKFFYRPAAIMDLPHGPENVQWALAREGKSCALDIVNASAYTVNFARINSMGESSNFGISIVAKPLETMRVPLTACPASDSLKVTPYVVNDYGVVEEWPEISLTQGAAARAGVSEQ